MWYLIIRQLAQWLTITIVYFFQFRLCQTCQPGWLAGGCLGSTGACIINGIIFPHVCTQQNFLMGICFSILLNKYVLYVGTQMYRWIQFKKSSLKNDISENRNTYFLKLRKQIFLFSEMMERNGNPKSGFQLPVGVLRTIGKWVEGKSNQAFLQFLPYLMIFQQYINGAVAL